MATNLTLGTLFTADVKNFLQGVNQIKTSLNSLHQAFTQAGSGAASMGKGIASGLNTTTAAINKQNAAIKASHQQLTGLAGMWQKVQQAMKTSLAYGTAGAAIYTVIDGLKKGVVTIAEYDQALKNLQAITQATDAEMVGLADTIKEVSSKYIFSTKEISDGMVLMGQAGFTATQTMQAMDAAAKLAMGTLEDMELTVDLLTTTVVSFNMRSVESEKIADIMANAMNRSKLTLDKLRVSFNYVGNAAYEAGISLEETAAAMSVMSNAGMRASTIGTAFRQVIANLIAPNRRVREEMQGLGIELSQLDPKVAGFSTVVQNLSKILVDQKTGLVDMSKAYSLFGLRAAQAAAILARSAADDYPKMLAMMYEVGSASNMADKQMEGLVARFKNLAANAQLIAVAIGEGGMTTVFRMLIDALTAVTKAIKAFVESELGQISIYFVSMTAAASAFIVTMKFLLGILTGLAVKAFGALIVSLQQVILLFNSLRMMNITQAFTSFFAALSMGHPALIGIAVAIGAIVTAIQYLNDAEERQIKSITRSSNAYRTAADTFSAYRDKLITLKEQMAKGKDVSVEYNATITRLVRAYPQLKGIIEQTTDAIDKNIDKLGEYEKASIEKDIEKQVSLLQVYDKQLASVGDSMSVFSSKSTESISQLAPEFAALGNETKQLEAEFSSMSDGMTESAKSSDELVDSFGDVVDAQHAVGEEAKKVNDIMKGKDAAFVAIAKGWEKLGDSLDTIKLKLRELGAEEGSIKAVESALKKWSDDVAKEAGEIEAAMQNLPHVFTEFFETLDAGAKVAFAKNLKTMESEVAQYQKTADAILKTQEDRYAAESFIRTKGLMKFADDVLKEKVTSEQLIRVKQRLIDEEKRLYSKRFDELGTKYTRIYEEELKAAKGVQEKILAAQEKYEKSMLTLRQKRVETVVAIEKGQADTIIEAYKKTADEVVKSGQRMADDYLKELDRLIDESKTKVKKLQKDKLKVESDTNEKIRKLRQVDMSDVEKYNDDQAAAQKFLSEGRQAAARGDYETSKEMLGKSSDIAEGLVRTVKDKNDRIIKSEKETADEAIRLLQDVGQAQKETIDREIQAEEERIKTAKSNMDDLNTAMKAFGGEWDKLNQDKLKVFISTLDDIIRRVDILTGKTSTIGKDWEIAKGKLQAAPQPGQPSLGAQPGLSPVQKKPEGEGTITVGGKTYDVNEFAGGSGQIGVGGKTYDLNEYAKGGEGTISIGGKTYDVNQLADYYKKVEDLNTKIQGEVEKSQQTVVTGVEDSGKQAVTSVGEISENTSKAVNESVTAVSAGVTQLSVSAATSATATEGLAQHTASIASSAEQMNAQWSMLSTTVEWIKAQFVEVLEIMTELAAKPINELLTDHAVTLLNEAKETLAEIKSDWDSLQSKTITLTINTKQGEGGGSGGDGGGGEGESSGGGVSYDNPDGGGYDETAYHRWGGLVQGVKDVANSVVTFARKGLKLPGWGGGDRVPVMAEAGEFIVNKESTRKFQPLIEAINSDTIVNTGRRFGGTVKAAAARVLRYQDGGSVPGYAMAGAGGSKIVIERLEIKPNFMTGDRASARKLAVEIERELSELQKRKGK